MKLLCRLILPVVAVLAGYLVLQPDYNTAHWTPIQLMQKAGFSYEFILAYEHYLHWFLHSFIGFLLPLLLYYARLYLPEKPKLRIVMGVVLVVSMSIMTEFLQLWRGGEIEIGDLIFDGIGIVLSTVFLVRFLEKDTACD